MSSLLTYLEFEILKGTVVTLFSTVAAKTFSTAQAEDLLQPMIPLIKILQFI